MIVKKYIKAITNNAEKDYVLDIGNLIIDNNPDSSKDKTFFMVIESEEFHKIMKLDSRLDNSILITYL